MGARLFLRTTRSLTLTTGGEAFLERCRRILREIEQAEEEVRQSSVEPLGRLKVSLPTFGAPFTSTLASFQLAYPRVEVDALFSDRKVDLVEEGFDVAVRSGDIGNGHLMTRTIGSFRMVVVAAPAYLDVHGVPLVPEDLAKHACIGFRSPSTGRIQPWLLQSDGQLHPHHPVVRSICTSIESRVAFVAAGVGLAYLPDFAVRQMVQDGRLNLVMDKLATYRNQVHLLWSSGRNPPPRVRSFIDHMAANIKLSG
ncbi:MAG: LysR substrate-binding domain-containing protein [Devosia sp.]